MLSWISSVWTTEGDLSIWWIEEKANMGNIATRIDDRGWSAEPRLPVFAIHRVPDPNSRELGLGSLVGIGWAFTFSRLVARLERASSRDGRHAYGQAFQIVTVVAAIGLIYASITLETPWLWRPAVPADLQAFVWLVILEFAGLPLTLLTLREE